MSIERLSSVDRLTHLSEQHRTRASELAEDIHRLLVNFRNLEAVPLDILDSVEREIVQTHTANLLRLNEPMPRKEAPDWAVSSLHDLACLGPSACSCEPIYLGEES